MKHICLRGLPWYFPCVSRSAGTLILTERQAPNCNKRQRGSVLHVKQGGEGGPKRDRVWRPYNGKEGENSGSRSTEGIPPHSSPWPGVRRGLARSVPILVCLTVASVQQPLLALLHPRSSSSGGGLSLGGPIPTPPPPSLSLMEGAAGGGRGGGPSCVVVVRPPWRRYGGGWSGGGGCMGVQYRRSVVKEPRVSHQRLTDTLSRDLATTPQRPYFDPGPRPMIRALRRVCSCFTIHASSACVRGRMGIWRGAPLERPSTQRRSRGVLPNRNIFSNILTYIRAPHSLTRRLRCGILPQWTIMTYSRPPPTSLRPWIYLWLSRSQLFSPRLPK